MELKKVKKILALHSKEKQELSVLHLVGSRVSKYYFNLSWFWSNEVKKLQHVKEYFVVVHPDGFWQIGESKDSLSAMLSMSDMLDKLPRVDVVVPHMYCFPGMTSYRAFFEDILNIPVVGPTAYSMGLATDKAQTRNIVSKAGITVAKAQELRKGDEIKMKLPFIIKPNSEDNSLGVTLVKRKNQIKAALTLAFKFDEVVLVEDYIPGREIRVAVININEELWIPPILEYLLTKENPIRTIDNKFGPTSNNKDFDWHKSKSVCPAQVDKKLFNKLTTAAKISHQALGCKDYSFWEFRIHEKTNEPYLLEACPFWSFSELTSPLSKTVLAAGISIEDITSKIWSSASKRSKVGRGSHFKYIENKQVNKKRINYLKRKTMLDKFLSLITK